MWKCSVPMIVCTEVLCANDSMYESAMCCVLMRVCVEVLCANESMYGSAVC